MHDNAKSFHIQPQNKNDVHDVEHEIYDRVWVMFSHVRATPQIYLHHSIDTQ